MTLKKCAFCEAPAANLDENGWCATCDAFKILEQHEELEIKMDECNQDAARLKILIAEAKWLLQYTRMSNRADHFQQDYRKAWDFVRQVARLEIEEG